MGKCMSFKRLKISTLLLLLFLPTRFWATPTHAASTSIVFIVNNHNPVTSIDRSDLIDYYEKRRRIWPGGFDVRFVDHIGDSPERSMFLRVYLQRSESDVQFYWFSQKIHSGTRMPVQASSDQAVIDLVKSFEGGIGYVSSTTQLNGMGVKEVKITGVPE
jgi:ABC-type phosphate transport system substrate-binding protein